jgi:MFS family permease
MHSGSCSWRRRSADSARSSPTQTRRAAGVHGAVHAGGPAWSVEERVSSAHSSEWPIRARAEVSPGTRRGTLLLLAAATAIGALGLAAGGSAGALLAEDLTGSTASAGLPLGLLVVGAAASALLIARQSSRKGRTAGLVLGYALGTAGALLVVLAAALSDFALLLVGSAGLGAANSAIFLTRYAAADLGGEVGRGRALGMVFFATALGAVASPNLLGPSGDLAGALGLPRLSGLYLVAVAAFAVAGMLLAAHQRRSPPAQPAGTASRREVRAGLGRARLALLVLAASNLIMVAVMAIAPIHLAEHGHGLDFVGVVISIHVLCMFAPSPLSGWLADRVGSATVAALGALLLVAACVGGVLLDMTDGASMTAILAVLGLGWNAGVVGGSTMLTASVPSALRPHTEGIGEVAMGLAAGAGAPIAGVIVAFGDFAALSIAGALGGVFMLAALRLGEPARPEATVGRSL